MTSPAPAALTTPHGALPLPTFVPDATRAAVRGVRAGDVRAQGIDAVLVSTPHLSAHPGAQAVRTLGGVHELMGWPGVVVSDSGGYQVYSLLGSSEPLAAVSRKGLKYRFSTGTDYRQLTPRSCIEAQLRIGADIAYCLDLCTHPSAPRAEQEESVAVTLEWAKACRVAFDRLVEARDGARPLLFAVVQGGQHHDLRARCAEGLVELGFDGYGFGGYPISGGQLVDEVALVAELLPPGSVLHGLGIGTPENVVAAWRAGYSIFDCTLPTRNGRRGVLYTDLDVHGDRVCRTANLLQPRWVRAKGPVDASCDCEVCKTTSAGYLAHLYAVDEALGRTLGSIHNLRAYARLMEALRGERRR